MFLGIILALAAAAGWAHNSIVYTFSGKRVGSNTTAHIRLWIALPACWFIQLLITGNILPQSHSVLSLIATVASGILGYFVADMFIFKSFILIGPRDTMLILTTSPIFSALFSYIFYAEILSLFDIISAILILTGIVIVIMDSTEWGWNNNNANNNNTSSNSDNISSNRGHARKNRKVGIIAAFIGSLGQSLGIVLSKYSLTLGDSPVEINLLRIVSGLIAMLVFLGFQKKVAEDFKKMADLRALGLIAFGAVVGPTLGVLAALYSALFIPVGLTAVLMQTTPVMLIPIERIFFGRVVNKFAVLGIGFSIIGIILLFIF